MTAQMKRLLYLVLGLLAGAITWGAEELMLQIQVAYLLEVIAQGSVIGFVFGLTFGAAEGIAISESRKALLTAALGAGIGAIAGCAATIGAAAAMIATSNSLQADYATTVRLLLPLSRIVAWAVVGAAVGSVEGIRSRSLRRAVAGLLGGLAGGLLGGAGLEGLIRLVPDQAIGRLAGFLILGAGIGFFLGEFERRFSFARLRVLSGPLKNKEYVLSRRRTLIGSGFASEVYLSAYPGTEGRHAEIVTEGREMRVKPSQGAVTVNEKSVHESRYLKYQDVIDLGGARLLLLPV